MHRYGCRGCFVRGSGGIPTHPHSYVHPYKHTHTHTHLRMHPLTHTCKHYYGWPTFQDPGFYFQNFSGILYIQLNLLVVWNLKLRLLNCWSLILRTQTCRTSQSSIPALLCADWVQVCVTYLNFVFPVLLQSWWESDWRSGSHCTGQHSQNDDHARRIVVSRFVCFWTCVLFENHLAHVSRTSGARLDVYLHPFGNLVTQFITYPRVCSMDFNSVCGGVLSSLCIIHTTQHLPPCVKLDSDSVYGGVLPSW